MMKSRPASALLLSIFMMSMLIMISVGVAFLVSEDVGTVRTIVSGMQARYAAEGMGELGLHILKENLPGYEPEFDEYLFSTNALASLEITAREQKVPCSVRGEDEWRSLSPNESVQLALFAQVESDASEENTEQIEKFYVEFYVEDEDGEAVSKSKLSSDILRWKILGFRGGETEAISEYIPLQDGRSTAESPTLFGSSLPIATADEGYTMAKFYRDEGASYTFYPAYSIAQFLLEHEFNYLVLTNILQTTKDYTIKFRLVSEDYEAVCEYVTLESTADVDFGTARQSIQTIVKEGENLPVFDFVLYHTAEPEEETTESILEELEFDVDLFPSVLEGRL